MSVCIIPNVAFPVYYISMINFLDSVSLFTPMGVVVI